jgi:hypothetical protein
MVSHSKFETPVTSFTALENMRRDFAGFRLDHHRPLHPSAIVSQMPTIADAEYE